MRTLVTSLLSIALLGCCRMPCTPCEPVTASAVRVAPPAAMPLPVTDPADAVYDAFIRSFLDGETAKDAHPGGRVTELVFARLTAHADEPALDGKFRGWDWLHDELKALRQETFDAFTRENAQQRDLNGRVRFGGQVEFLTEEQLDKQFEGGTDEGWTRFHRAHPGAAGILSMSSVGISADGRQALLYVSFVAGGLDGWGRYFLYERGDRSWTVVAHLEAWVS
jgi:hypothetical protein